MKPPSPKGHPLLQLIHWIARPTHYLETNARRYGDIFVARWAGFAPFVIISQPQAIQEIFAVDGKCMDAGRVNGILRPLLGDFSILLTDGDRHQRQRRLLTPPFHGDRMRAYGSLICDITAQVLNQATNHDPVSVRSAMQEISLEVILHAVFGMSQGDRHQQLKRLLSQMLDSVSSPISATALFLPLLQQDVGDWSPWGQFLRRRQEVDQILYSEIQSLREHPDPTREDILSLLMSAQDESGQTMTDVELRDELMTLLIAGHETTASALTWALYWVESLPDVSTKLAKELRELDGNLDLATVNKLPYLNAVCQEALRLYPVLMLSLPRVPRVPFKLMGYDFEPGTILVPCIYLTHHREDLYPQPKQFNPDRFLERSFSPFEYLPFGGGNRRCIGMAFANFEMKLVLATILSRFQLKLTSDRPVKAERRGLTLAPPGSLKMAVERRV